MMSSLTIIEQVFMPKMFMIKRETSYFSAFSLKSVFFIYTLEKLKCDINVNWYTFIYGQQVNSRTVNFSNM